jgi:hypothetical protein
MTLMRTRDTLMLSLAACALALVAVAEAATPRSLLAGYDSEARKADPAFPGFDPRRGEALFRFEAKKSDGTPASCTGCHTPDPKQAGRARVTGKAIAPLAPVANADRFTDPARTERWFQRNCNDVLARPCSAQEKGDFLTYLLSVQ